jgi:hypothetical protein
MEDTTPEITSLQELNKHAQNIIKSNKIHTDRIGEQLCKTTIAQQMAEKAYNPTMVNTEESILEEYQRHKKVFSEQEAMHFPLQRPWDHHIKLTKDTPPQ